MSVEINCPFIISDGCDETGKGQFEIRVDERQLNLLLEHDMIYEDTVSEYVEGSGRRHFHPMHEGQSVGELVDTIRNWPGYGGTTRERILYEAAGDITVNVPSNQYL